MIREPGFLCKEGKVEPKIKATDESMDKDRATFMHERQKAIMCVITNIHHSWIKKKTFLIWLINIHLDGHIGSYWEIHKINSLDW